MRRRVLFAAFMSLGLFFAACGTSDPDPTAEPDQGFVSPTHSQLAEDRTVVITAVEYAFNLPAELPPGATSFELINGGKEPHFIDIVQLTDDAPAVKDIIKLPEKKVGEYFVGQPNHIPTVKPGQTSKKLLEIDLVSGARYGYVCFFATKGQKPHAFLGMHGEFTVN